MPIYVTTVLMTLKLKPLKAMAERIDNKYRKSFVRKCHDLTEEQQSVSLTLDRNKRRGFTNESFS